MAFVTLGLRTSWRMGWASPLPELLPLDWLCSVISGSQPSARSGMRPTSGGQAMAPGLSPSGKSSPPDCSLEQLMTAYSEGDIQACTQLYHKLSPWLLAVYRRSSLPDAEAQELVQQTFLRIHMARARYRHGEPVRPWVLVIATRLLADRFRSARSRRERPFEENETERLSAPEPEPGLPTELEEELRQAIEALPASQREVIILHKLQGLPMQEVAARTGVSEAAVRVRASRAYEALRQALKGMWK